MHPCEDLPVGTWCWFVHHSLVCEPLTEPAENRLSYINTSKPAYERGVRLQAMRPVKHPERLPEAVARAGAEYLRARAEYFRAGAEYFRAVAEYARARAEYDRASAEYHRAWAEYDRASAECRPQLVVQYVEEYPENAHLVDAKLGELIFPDS